MRESLQFHPASVDLDIDRSKIACPILLTLLDRYDSFFVGDADYETDIYFHNRRFFFTFSHSHVPIYPNLTKVNGEFETEDIVPFATIMRCIYTIPMFRGQGIQRAVFEELKDISEQTKSPFIAYASPFRLLNSIYETSGKDAMLKMILNGYKKSKDYQAELKQQISRFREYGLVNIELEGLETPPEARFIYMPTTATNDYKKTVESLLRQ